jgi:GT2 family glycosyltransferase
MTTDEGRPTTANGGEIVAGKERLASVIVPVWNGIEFLERCLLALRTQDYSRREVVVVDNASSDGSADFVAEHFPEARLVRNDYNLGFAGGCNAGLRVADGEVLLLLNQDTEVSPDWLRHVVEALEAPEVGVVGCKIFYPDGERLQHAGAWFDWPLALAHHYGHGEDDSGAYDEPRMVEYVTGAAMGFRREVMERVGLLDEGFWPGYFEDADFCFRAREAGFEIWYRPEATLRHTESTSIKDPVRRSRYYQRGRMRFLLKHIEPERWLREFVPAEKVYQPPAIFGMESRALRLGYLEMMLGAVPILRERWNASAETINEVYDALEELHRASWESDWQRIEGQRIEGQRIEGQRIEGQRIEGHKPPPYILFPELVGGEAYAAERDDVVHFPLPRVVPLEPSNFIGTLPPPSPPPTASFREFEFRPRAPLVGVFVARFRSLWHSVSGRWAIRDLMDQLEAYARQQAAVNQRQEAINARYERLREWQEAINLRQYLFMDRQSIVNQWQAMIHEQQSRFNEQQSRFNEQQSRFNEQQSRFNEEQRHTVERQIQGLNERLMDAVRENELLAREIAELRLRLETMQGGEGE